MPICVHCEHYQSPSKCTNADLPVTNFITGSRFCYDLNDDGNCKGFKAKAKPESIYESKEDKELAKVGIVLSRKSNANTD